MTEEMIEEIFEETNENEIGEVTIQDKIIDENNNNEIVSLEVIENSEDQNQSQSGLIDNNEIDPQQLKMFVEAALLANENPMTVEQIRHLFDEFERPAANNIREAISVIQQECENRGVELVEVASGFRMQIKMQFGARLGKLWEEKPPRYSRALLETLALIAYRQPITRAEIEDIRGVVVSSHIIKILLDRDWIRVVGHRDVPGKPGLYATTKQFLDYFNMKSLADLPTLTEIKNLDILADQLASKGNTENVVDAQDRTDLIEHLQSSVDAQEDNSISEHHNIVDDLLQVDLNEQLQNTDDEQANNSNLELREIFDELQQAELNGQSQNENNSNLENHEIVDELHEIALDEQLLNTEDEQDNNTNSELREIVDENLENEMSDRSPEIEIQYSEFVEAVIDEKQVENKVAEEELLVEEMN